jgi:hypothetical protein
MSIFMLNILMLSLIVLSVTMLSVFMLRVIMLSARRLQFTTVKNYSIFSVLLSTNAIQANVEAPWPQLLFALRGIDVRCFVTAPPSWV